MSDHILAALRNGQAAEALDLAEAQLAELEALKDAEFDALWLSGMIMHHEGAVVMAEDVTDSANVEVSHFASHVIEDQTAEIAKMKDLLG